MKRPTTFLDSRGMSTVELLLIMSALVSVAILFKGSLMGFTELAIEKVFNDPPKAERMTFGSGGN